MVIIWFLLTLLFLFKSDNLLLSVLLIEIASFFLLVFCSISYPSLDYIILALFCIFVIEGVVALSGLIILVSFSGSDYISSTSFLNL